MVNQRSPRFFAPDMRFFAIFSEYGLFPIYIANILGYIDIISA